MIQPLRTAHHSIFLVLAALLPTIIAAGLSSRRAHIANGMPPIPSLLAVPADSGSIFWKNARMTAQVYPDSANPDSVRLLLNPSGEISDTDLLIYGAGHDVSNEAELSDARLLGSFSAGKSISLSRGQQGGFLVIYSFAHRVVVDTAKIERAP